jgi:hypothetical protein
MAEMRQERIDAPEVAQLQAAQGGQRGEGGSKVLEKRIDLSRQKKTRQ